MRRRISQSQNYFVCCELMARELDAAESYSQENKVLFHLPPSSTFSLVDSSKMTLKGMHSHHPNPLLKAF